MVEDPPIGTLAGSGEHEITGGRGRLTVNRAPQDAKPFLLPSLKLAMAWYRPGCKPVVSICMEAPVEPAFTPVPLQVYLIVRLGLKLFPLAVAVTGSPAKMSPGCTEHSAVGGTGGGPPPNMKFRPVCTLTPRRSVLGVVALGPNR